MLQWVELMLVNIFVLFHKITGEISDEESKFLRLLSLLIVGKIADFTPNKCIDKPHLEFPNGIKHSEILQN